MKVFGKLSFGKKALLGTLLMWFVIVALFLIFIPHLVCLSGFVLVFLLLISFMYWHEMEEGFESDAHRIAKKMRKINLDAPMSLKNMFDDDYEYRLALTKSPRTAAAFYFFACYIPQCIGAFVVALLLSSYIYNIYTLFLAVLIGFAVPQIFRAYKEKKALERAIEILKKGELDEEYYEPHLTFPLKEAGNETR